MAQLFNPRLRANRMTVGTAIVLLQLSEVPTVLGCAEIVANRLARCTAGGPACAVRLMVNGIPQFALTSYGMQVKAELQKRISLNA